MSYWRGIWVLVEKDLRLELRSKETWATTVLLAVLVLLVFVFGAEGEARAQSGLLAGVLWASLLFGALVGLGRSFAKEREDGRLTGMLLAPVDRSAIFFAKWVGAVGLLLTMAMVVIPVFSAFFGVSLSGPWWQWAVLVALTVGGLAGSGVLLAAVSVQTRAPDLLLPLLLIPLWVPLLLGAVSVTRALLADSDWQSAAHWLRMLLAYDVVFVFIPYLLFEYVVEV